MLVRCRRKIASSTEQMPGLFGSKLTLSKLTLRTTATAVSSPGALARLPYIEALARSSRLRASGVESMVIGLTDRSQACPVSCVTLAAALSWRVRQLVKIDIHQQPVPESVQEVEDETLLAITEPGSEYVAVQEVQEGSNVEREDVPALL
jgi:hypothetical protein